MDHTPHGRQEEVEAAGLVGLWWLRCRGIGAACDLGPKLEFLRCIFAIPSCLGIQFLPVWLTYFELQSCIAGYCLPFVFNMVLCFNSKHPAISWIFPGAGG